MEQKLEEIKKEDKEYADEYFDFIKDSVNDGSYFKDALDWYSFRYVTPICDRTLLIFGAIIAAVVLFFLYQMIERTFPLVEKDPIFIKAGDQSRYFPSLVNLKPKEGQSNYDPAVKTVDEAVLKYLLLVYIKDREGFDFSKAQIAEVNEKFNRIRSTSSAAEYRKFQLVMSKDNPHSPIYDFGKNIKRIIRVESVKFITKESEGFASKAISYIAGKIPTDAEIRFIATMRTVNEDRTIKDENERYVARINFLFGGVNKDTRSNEIKFVVNNYQLFKVK